jgi:phage major head subunit gpT-like protein
LLGDALGAVDHQQHQVAALDRAHGLGRAMREAERISAAGVFNNAFTAGATAGPDGLALCHTAHTLPYPGAGTSSNRLAVDADLSQTSIQDMVTLMRKTRDGSGKKILVKPQFLAVPAELEFLATELLDATSKPQASTANNVTEVNAPNALRSRYGLEPVVLDYLTDADAWFLVAGKGSHKLFWYWRKQPQTSSDTEFKSDVALMKIKARWAVGFSDFRGICGTSGG